MKVVAILETEIHDGGGFNQSLNSLSQMARICQSRFDFEIMTSVKGNLSYLNKLGMPGVVYEYKLIDRIFPYIIGNLCANRMMSGMKIKSPLEKKLVSLKADIVYFVEPSTHTDCLQDLNFISTVWDLCHRDFPEFPEIREGGRYISREYHCANRLNRSYLVIVDSDQLAEKLTSFYGIGRDRLLVMPFGPSPFLLQNCSDNMTEVLRYYDLKEGYFFYPAQIWPHKNHIRIIEALDILRNRGVSIEVVFVGADKGNQNYLKGRLESLNLQNRVHFLGFVPPNHMQGLYQACAAVLMPTYFGPTNLPPLEAWMIGKPLLYSEHLKDQVGDAALLVNPDKAESLAKAMASVLEPEFADGLVSRGKKRLREIERQRVSAEAAFLSRLLDFNNRRKCWDNHS